ncbi:MAG: DUF1343 domain-containing protein [Myxococcales bacterium FL481]|nr:MAG: DUF1343 domain-containing protein [Myxococcales bacterium FL481]
MSPPTIVATGLDRIEHEARDRVAGQRVTLLCHPASVNRRLEHATRVLPRVGAEIVSLLGPEHGIDAAAQDMAAVDHHAASSDPVPVYSLYGADKESLRPEPAMFHGADTLVCDLQDIGARYYTYVWTVVLAAEAALEAGLSVVVLDRPNPLGGRDVDVEGGTVQPGFESFVGLHPVSTRHGMTLAELTQMTLAERGAKHRERCHIVPCTGWRRAMDFAQTGLPWVMPSPNMPTLDTAWIYPGQCLLEGTNLSEGRGTTRPFELFGAPWLDGSRLEAAIGASDRPGLSLRPTSFQPMFQKHAGERCGGAQIHIRDRAAVRSVRTTYALLCAAWRLGGNNAQWRTEAYEFVSDIPAIDLLAGGPWLREGIESGASALELVSSQAHARDNFVARRRAFLIYDG